MNPLKKIQYSLFTLLFLLLVAQGCSKSQVSEPEAGSAFPEDRYLSAQGMGRTRNDARQQALAELSQIFESRVSSEFSSFARSSLSSDQAEDFEKTMESRIHIVSGIRLQGAKIGKEWEDKATGMHNALAVLDRMDAGRGWTSKVEILDHGIQAETQALKTMTGPLSRMASLNRILDLVMERQIWESRLRVIDYPVKDFSHLDTDLGAVMSERSELKSGLRVYIEVQGGHGDRVMEILAQGLTQKGISLVKDPATANARVLGYVEITLLSLDNPNAYFVRAHGNVRVFESQTLFAGISEKVRKGHGDQAEAMHMALESVSRTLSDKLLGVLGFNPDNRVK